jgi:hypothetical protein
MVVIVGLGHARSGTKYLAELIRAFGYDVKHEKLGKDGIVAWQWVIGKQVCPWGCPPRKTRLTPDDKVIHLVRQPWKIVASVLVNDFGYGSNDFRKRLVPWLFYRPQVDQVCLSVWTWNRFIDALPADFRVSVESAPKQLEQYFNHPPKNKLPGPCNQRSKPPNWQELRTNASADIRKLIDNMAADYGYEL